MITVLCSTAVALGFAGVTAGGDEIAFERIQLSPTFYCEGASFADFNRDGKTDVVAGPYWYAGPEFKAKTAIYTPAPFDPAGYSDNFFAFPRDMDGDGWIDVFVVGFPGEAAAWFANPKGGERPWERHQVFDHVDNESPTFTDLTGDGRPELVCINGGHLGWAAPDWRDPAKPWKFHRLSEDLGLERFTHGLGVGDVDGDGKADVLLATGWWAQPASLAGDPAWKFHDFKFTDQYGGAQMYVYDVDGDGLNDVVTSLAAHHYGLSWFRQVKKDGEIGFVEQKLMSSKPDETLNGVRFGELHALDLVDVDGDGLRDIVMGKRWWSHGAKGDPDGADSKAWLYWWGLTRPAKGEAKWTPHAIDADTGVGVQVVAGDVNDDGKTDVVVGNKKGAFVLVQKRAARGTAALGEERKIELLLSALESSGAKFVRNGSEYDGKAAAEHLRSKWKQAGGTVGSARQFIELVASNSSASGKPYMVVLSDGTRLESAAWLTARLEIIESLAEPANGQQSAREPRVDGGAPKAKGEKQQSVAPSSAVVRADDVERLFGPAVEVPFAEEPGEYAVIVPGGTTISLGAVRSIGADDGTQPGLAQDAGTLPLGDDGKPLNLDFETGDLRDWTADNGAFDGQPIHGDTTSARGREPSLHQGEYWLGGYEKHGDGPRGSLTSKAFTITAPWASFLVGGGAFHDERVELVRSKDQQVVFRTSAADYESLQRVVVDLTHEQGERVFLRIVDDNSGGWGHVNFDDFRFHARKPSFARPAGVPEILTPDSIVNAGMHPEEAARAMTVPPGFQVDLIAAEPDLHQPVALAIDGKGRIWVVEAFSYPQRRPEGQGLDDVVVFEDADHDGSFEKRTVFAERLNLVSGIELGYGGVWIGAAPYLMFIPDRDDDLVPDGPPEILLDGWSTDDTHETLNAFNWGPDGWLYGCHGVFTHSLVGAPGTPDDKRTPLNAGVWRYHPTEKRFEIFAWGTSNPWGVDFDDHGQAFITACVIPHLYHVIQGARYERQAGVHFDPFVYDDIKTIADHRHYIGSNPHGGNLRSDAAGGGHAHCGAMVYLGGAFPPEYRNAIFMSNIHGNRINEDRLVPSGSGFVGTHADDFLRANDAWFRGINLKYGPDGSVYLIDWYDKQACHWTEIERWDRTNGRLYRVRYGAEKPVAVDVPALSDAELVALQSDRNDWYVRQARLALAERRGGKEGRALLEKMLAHPADQERALRALWALHACGGLTQERALAQLASPYEYVQAWAVQFLLEDRDASPAVAARLAELARATTSPVVRLYLASALQRMRLYDRWPIAAALLAHGEDAADHNLPLMYWYGVEPLVAADPARALALAERSSIALVTSYVWRRAAAQDLCHDALVKALAAEPNADRRAARLADAAESLRGRRAARMPAAWEALYAELERSPDERVRADAQAVAIAFGDPRALAEQRAVLANASAPLDRRESALEACVLARDPELPALLPALVAEPALRSRALKALAGYEDPQTPQRILALWGSLSPDEKRDALNTLSSRPAWGRELLAAVAAKTVPTSDLGAFVLRNLQNLKDPEVDALLKQEFAAVRDTPESKQRRIRELKGLLAGEALTVADRSQGREVFARTCMQCHTLFDAGGTLAPDLTGSNRRDLDYLLSNVVDPSAVVGKDYQAWIAWTKDGLMVTGVLKRDEPAAITLQTENDTVVVQRDEIEELKQSDVSTMPEGLLDALTPLEIVALVAYLQGDAQVPMRASAATTARFFDGKTLAGWKGDGVSWSVENGEIVGRTSGLARNEFLVSDLELGDFRLACDVKLTGNEGNSGIQFRTKPTPEGVQGYQADIGPGWWGKLYEEEGRGLLSERSGEEFVKPGDWNRYEILAVGHHVKTWINGQPCVDLEDPAGALRGIVALQLHSGGPTEIRLRNFQLELEPKP